MKGYMKMIKILILGNSFGQDSVRYLNGISRAGKKEIRVVNLYIGGCSLYRHYRNMLSEEAAYKSGNRLGYFSQKSTSDGRMGLRRDASM